MVNAAVAFMNQSMGKPVNILILGAGFAGINAYLSLHELFHDAKEVKITLVSKTDEFLFVPLLHEVATGNLTPKSIVQPVRALPRCCLYQFIEGEVRAVDLDKQKVEVGRSNGNTLTLPYDYLVIALGSDTNFFDVPGAATFALDLKNMTDAKKIKNRMIELMEEGLPPHLVVVGGGPTGVELVGEIADFLNYELTRAFPEVCRKAEITLIQASDRLVDGVEEWFSKKTIRILKKMGVKILLNEQVQEVTKDGVKTQTKFVPASMTVWTAGVKANEIKLQAKKPVEFEQGKKRIKVNDYLQTVPYPNAFVVGDMAWICDKEKHQPYPMRAQFAVREGRCAGRNIYYLMNGEPLEEFFWRDKGFIISLGRRQGLAKVLGIKFGGPIAWFAYRSAYLANLVGWRAKIRTAVEWSLNLFLPRDISKL